MIQISEILELALFKDFKIICGEKYLSNLVNANGRRYSLGSCRLSCRKCF